MKLNYQQQLTLDKGFSMIENPHYLSNQIITYIGNKRTLLNQINQCIEKVKQKLGKSYLSLFDVFSGSGIVSRLFKSHSELLITNDLEDYASLLSRCYLSNKNEININELREIIDELNQQVETNQYNGFIKELYSPSDENNITKQDRVFYTPNNAHRLDNYRVMIGNYPTKYQDLLIGPLITSASIHCNTSGVFKGFYKNSNTGIGQYGGNGKNALNRITKTIQMEMPILSNFECEYHIFQDDANIISKKIKEIDLTYIDPPYNQHPYSANYFMLNLLASYKRPNKISLISGIPTDWNRSGYNIKNQSAILLKDLIYNLDSKFLLISFNNEGFISLCEMQNILQEIGIVNTIEIPYNTFRGSRNLKKRPIHVSEFLFLVEKTK